MTTKSTARDLILWLAFLAGPVFWLISFQAKFSWTPITCATQSKVTVFLFSAIAFVLTAIAGLLAWRAWRSVGTEQPGERGRPIDRTRFMALGAVVFCAGFCVVIIAQAIPDLILGACQ
jgi:ABC-type Fe3+-siderophore transport system permease subunit